MFMISRKLCILTASLSGLLVFVQSGENDKKIEKGRTCGYDGCPDIHFGKLNVHLVAHTHDDVGWLKTIEEYFYGLREDIQRANVQSILDTVIEALRANPERRFIYVETAYLWKWWLLQDERMQEEVKSYINEGRLEIIGGGWSMNDEAITHYQSIIDQFTWGFRRLNDTFGVCARPKIGWQIDPFGHSREQVSLFAQMGFDSIFTRRVSYLHFYRLLRTRSAEFLWHGSPSLGKRADLFASMLPNGYDPPTGFCFDVSCADPDIEKDDDNSSHVQDRIQEFHRYVKIQANSYRSNNILITMGGDFHYRNAGRYFQNLDRLIQYSNKYHGAELNVFYSSPSCYIKSVHDANLTWTTKADDFLPYADRWDSFWTGYYTSRPSLKYFERIGNNFLQIIKQLSVLSNMGDSADLQFFREVMGVMQHHDAITGTEKQHVADDYCRILFDAIVRAEENVSKAIGKLSSKVAGPPSLNFKSCLLLNISVCEPSESSGTFIVTLYNPGSHPASKYVRLPVRGNAYIIKDSLGNHVPKQLLPIPSPVLNIPGRQSNATRELVFYAPEIPPLGYQSFYITENSAADIDEISTANDSSYITNDWYDVSIDDSGTVLVSWKNKSFAVNQTFNYYEGETRSRPSGAYTFRPKQSLLHNFTFSGSRMVYKGPLVDELHLIYNDHISQVVRVYKGEEVVELDWTVGPIPVEDNVSKEVLARYSSNVHSSGVFYTDGNGRELMKRVRSQASHWYPDLKPITENYYPVTNRIALQDDMEKLRMTVFTDRAQGGSSLRDGELEVMLHRRLLVDDGLGVEEPLDEKAFGKGLVVRGTHYLMGRNLSDIEGAEKERFFAQSLILKPWVLVTPGDGLTFEEWHDGYLLRYQALETKLPENIHILTLEPWKEGILLRLEHLFEVGEGRSSDPVTVNLKALFADFAIADIRETTLGGNQWIEDMNRLVWTPQDTDERPEVEWKGLDVIDGKINALFNPMDIRTFIIHFHSN